MNRNLEGCYCGYICNESGTDGQAHGLVILCYIAKLSPFFRF